MKLLLAEDTIDLSRAEVAVLSHEGYEVDAAYDGEQALQLITAGTYDGIILDIMMPKMTGLEVLTEIRSRGITAPVLLLTAKAEIDDRVTGLDMGADDYLTKPFAMKELLARVRSMTRRKTDYSLKDMKIGDIRLNSESFELASENTVRLSIKEFELMQTLILNAGHPLATDYLIARIWATEPDANSDTVWLYISYLRKKLDSIDSHVRIAGDRGGSFTLNA
ncbi:MAG: response regulator transcription factor [Lachnospiraceae bacterium]|jgi:DNA-binding response OmpR family regulator|nr:response regulator transcription factor [Lachnospiraceae bacterium]